MKIDIAGVSGTGSSPAAKVRSRVSRLLTGSRKQKASAKSGRVVSFLHLGKNAGSQIEHVIDIVNASDLPLEIVHHGHDVALIDIPADRDYFFSIRNPISRFKSGFYSRKRRGQPLYNYPWSVDEEKAFTDFEHANDLAEALFSDGKRGSDAFGAIKSIRHTSMNQVDWFSRMGNFLDTRPPLMIVRQENFSEDFARLEELLGITELTSTTNDDVKAHRNDYSKTPNLSEKAIANLTRWYCQDIEFYRLCVEWIEART